MTIKNHKPPIPVERIQATIDCIDKAEARDMALPHELRLRDALEMTLMWWGSCQRKAKEDKEAAG